MATLSSYGYQNTRPSVRSLQAEGKANSDLEYQTTANSSGRAIVSGVNAPTATAPVQSYDASNPGSAASAYSDYLAKNPGATPEQFQAAGGVNGANATTAYSYSAPGTTAPSSFTKATSPATALTPIEKRKQDRQAKLDSINIQRTVQTGTDKEGNPIFGQIPDEAATQAAKDAEMNRQMNEDKMMTDSFNKNISDAQTAGGATFLPGQKGGPTKPEIDPLEKAFQDLIANTSDPATKAALQYQHYSDQAEKKRKQEESAQLTKDEEVARATALTNEKSAEVDAAAQQVKDLEFNQKQDELNRQAVENAKLDAQNTLRKNQAQAALDGQIAYHNQDIQNDETEMQNRNAAAAMGINYDTGGLQWMQTQKQKGVTALNFISQQIALNDVAFAEEGVKISRDYTQNVFTASQFATQQYNIAVKTYKDAIRSAKSDYATVSNSLTQYYTTQKEKLADDIFRIDQHQGDTIATAVKDLNDRKDKLTTATEQKRQWEADYNYKVDAGNRQYLFDEAKWQQEKADKEAEILASGDKATLDQFYKDNDIRTKLITDIRSAYNQDEYISSYDKTFLPAKTAWDSALADFQAGKGDVSSSLDSLTAAYKQMTNGAQAAGLAGGFASLGIDFLASKEKYTAADVPSLIKKVTDIYDAAKSRRDGKVDGLRAQIEAGNRTISDSSLRVRDSVAGLPFTPPSASRLSNITSLSSAARTEEKTINIGGDAYTGPNEMLLRMKIADDAYFQDHGKHLGFSLGKSAEGYDITAKSDDAYDYMVGAGLQEASTVNTSGADTLGAFFQGVVTQDFNTAIASREHGGLYDSSTVTAWGGKHSGIDIAMPVGTPLQVPKAMTVIEAGNQPGWGFTVLGKTADGALIRFAHLDSVSVKKGDMIGPGQTFAKSGNTGNSTGPHLDLRVRVNGAYIDPRSYSLTS